MAAEILNNQIINHKTHIQTPPYRYITIQKFVAIIFANNKINLLIDTVVLEFNQYAPGSRWRHTMINRRDHREEGNEADGFYGGIRKLYHKDEISTWQHFWPADILE